MDSMNAIPSWPRRYRVHRIHSRTRGLLYRSRRDRHDELRVQQGGGVMIARVDGLLDRITMYRLVLWYLVTLLLCALALGTLHVIAINPVATGLMAMTCKVPSARAQSSSVTRYQSTSRYMVMRSSKPSTRAIMTPPPC